jgi:hypothetical protein
MPKNKKKLGQGMEVHNLIGNYSWTCVEHNKNCKVEKSKTCEI